MYIKYLPQSLNGVAALAKVTQAKMAKMVLNIFVYLRLTQQENLNNGVTRYDQKVSFILKLNRYSNRGSNQFPLESTVMNFAPRF